MKHQNQKQNLPSSIESLFNGDVFILKYIKKFY